MLSLGTESEAKALCKRTNAEASREKTLIDQRRMLANIRRMREKGYFFSKGMVIPGTGAIAMMLPPAADGGKRPLAISVVGVLEDLMRREHVIVGQMREAIQRHFGLEMPVRRSK
jgi:DNA-binding IclR family transcriptional regulator